MPKDPRPVIQHDLEGNAIQQFSSASQAAKTLLVKETLIRASLYDKKKKVMGKWRFVFTDKEAAKIEPPKEPELASSVDFKTPDAESFDADKLPDLTIDEPAMFAQPDQDRREIFADLSRNPDRWLTPFEKIINRRNDS